MKTTAFAALATAFLAAPAFADGHATGDAAEGESLYKKCKSCHMISDADGNDIVKGGKTGPNQYALHTRAPGTVEGFRYSKGLKALGEQSENWNEEMFVAWVQDPSGYLTEQLGKKERSKMSYKLRDEQEARDIWAYIVSLGPDADS